MTSLEKERFNFFWLVKEGVERFLGGNYGQLDDMREFSISLP